MGKRMKKFLVVLLLNVLWCGPALAGGNADQAKAMVDEAVSFLQANGEEKALAELNNPKGKFVKGELYVFAYDLNAVVVAQPVNPKLLGKNLMEVPDADGKLFRKEIVEVAKSKGVGWVDYKYKNPESGKMEHKTTYLKKASDIVICCGIYKQF